MVADYNKDVDAVIGLIQKTLGFYKKNPPLRYSRKVFDGEEYISWPLGGFSPNRHDYHSINLLSDGSVIVEVSIKCYRIPLRHIKSLGDFPRYAEQDLPYGEDNKAISRYLCAGLRGARGSLERIAADIDNHKPPKNKNGFLSKFFGK